MARLSHIVKHSVVMIAISIVVLASFQNCGSGFMTKDDMDSSAGFSQVGAAGDIPPVANVVLSSTQVTPGQTVTATVTATANQNNESITQVDLLIDGAVYKSLTSAPYTFQITGLAANTYTIVARATDNLNGITQTGSQALTVSAVVNAKALCTQAAYQPPTWTSNALQTVAMNINLAPDTTSVSVPISFTAHSFPVEQQLSFSAKSGDIAINSDTSKTLTMTVAAQQTVECKSGSFTVTATLLDGCETIAGFTPSPSAQKQYTINYTNTCPAEDRMVQSTPISQEALGVQVATDGTVVVTTAPQFSNVGKSTGAAYVFAVNNPSGIDSTQIALLTPSTTANQKITAVAVGNGMIVLGTSSLPGVPGAVYVYKGSAATWTLTATIPEPVVAGQSAGDPLNFGTAVQILNDGSIAVGTPGQDVGGLPVAGAVHIFSATTFAETSVITAAAPVAFEYFGTALSTSGTSLVVGAPYRASLESTSLTAVGSVYLFSNLVQSAHIKMTKVNAIDVFQFGQAVSTDGTHIAVGAPIASSGGAVYVYNMDGTPAYGPYASGEGTGGTTLAGDLFGQSVQVSGSTVWIGAPGNSSDTGAIFKFAIATPTKPTFKLVAEPLHRAANAQFGAGFVVYGADIAIGSPGFTGLAGGVATYVNSGIGFIIAAP